MIPFCPCCDLDIRIGVFLFAMLGAPGAAFGTQAGLGSCFPTSQNRDMGHPAFLQSETARSQASRRAKKARRVMVRRDNRKCSYFACVRRNLSETVFFRRSEWWSILYDLPRIISRLESVHEPLRMTRSGVASWFPTLAEAGSGPPTFLQIESVGPGRPPWARSFVSLSTVHCTLFTSSLAHSSLLHSLTRSLPFNESSSTSDSCNPSADIRPGYRAW